MYVNILKKFKSEFVRNVFILISGSTIAVLIPVFLSPVISRLFTPSDFGIFSIYSTFVTIISAFITLRYELSVMVPRGTRNILNIFVLCIIVIFVNMIILFIIVIIIGKKNIFGFFNASDLEDKIIYLFFGILLSSILQVVCYVLNRFKSYKLLSVNRVASVIISSFSKVILGYKNLGSIGLVISHLIEISFSNVNMGYRLFFKYLKNQKFSLKKIYILGKNYIRFPLFNLPCDIVYLLASYIHIFLFLKYFTEDIVGIISFTSKVILVPLMIFASSFSHVFFQRISEFNDIEKLRKFYLNSLFLILLITPIVILIGYIIPITTIAEIFGNEWRELHKYIFPITIWVSGDFIISSIYTIFIKLRRFAYLFIFNLSSLISTVSLFLIYYNKSYSAYSILVIISLARYLIYIILSGYSMRFFKSKLKFDY